MLVNSGEIKQLEMAGIFTIRLWLTLFLVLYASITVLKMVHCNI